MALIGEPGRIVMMILGGVLIYLAVAKDYEPTLLVPIGLGCILANIGDHNFRNCGTGWPWRPCSYSVGYNGTVQTREADSAPAPGIEVEVRDAQGNLAANPTTDDLGEAELALDEYSIYVEGYDYEQIFEITELNPYEFAVYFPDGMLRAATCLAARGFRVSLQMASE